MRMDHIKNLIKDDELDEFLFEKTKLPMCFVNTDGKFLRANNELVLLLEYTSYELEKMEFGDITHPADLHADLDLFNKIIHGEIDSYPMTKRYFTKTGKIVWARLIVTAVRGEENKVACFFSQIIPIDSEEDNKKTQKMLEKIREMESNPSKKSSPLAEFLKKEWKWIIMFGVTIIGGYITWEVNRRTEKIEIEQRFQNIEDELEEGNKTDRRIENKLDAILNNMMEDSKDGESISGP